MRHENSGSYGIAPHDAKFVVVVVVRTLSGAVGTTPAATGLGTIMHCVCVCARYCTVFSCHDRDNIALGI